MSRMPLRVLCVCMGNICRSPTAEAMLKKKIKNNNLEELITVDSCGTHGYHIGKRPDRRAIAAGLQRGLHLAGLRARELTPEDFERFDYILAMDDANLQDLLASAPPSPAAEVSKLLAYSKRFPAADVPDPYYGDADGFETVLDMLDDATDGLLEVLARRVSAR